MIRHTITYSDNISALHASSEGLWVGHKGGLSFFDPRTGAYAKWTTREGLPALPVLHVATLDQRLVVATPNGVAWTDDRAALLRDGIEERSQLRFERALAHPAGAGAYVNGVAFVKGRIYAATGGGRIYLEGQEGFQLVELPLRQARLLRVLELPSPSDARRLLIVTNNSGVLLLATGAGQEPSVYQWSEDEGLCSRYVTAAAYAGRYLTVGVHRCVHVAFQSDLVERPEQLMQWGRVVLSDLQGPPEQGRIHALAEHRDHLYAATSAGLYRVSVAELELAVHDRITAERVDEAVLRHLVSWNNELWAASGSVVGQLLEGARGPAPRAGVHAEPGGAPASEDDDAGERRSPAVRPGAAPRVTSFGRRWRFIPETRWRRVNYEPECCSVVTMVSVPEGLLVGGDSGRVILRVRDRWLTETIMRPRRLPEVQALACDPDSGSFWAATRQGLFHRDARGRWMRDVGFPGRAVHALCVWNGHLVAVGSAGLHSRVQGDWRSVSIPDETPSLFAAAASSETLALAGKPGAGMYLWSRGAPHPVRVELSMGRATCMVWGSAADLWFGTDNGIEHWDGKRAVALRWSGEPENQINALLVYNSTLYVGSHAGVWKAELRDLASPASQGLDGVGARAGVLDGLPNAHVTSLVVHEDSVWVGTRGGLAVLE